MTHNFQFGLLRYSSVNIGDEIQSIAASRFLPRIDCLVPRDKIKKFTSGIKTKLIMNAWWMWKPKNFPPSKDIEPLLISMHISRHIRKKFLKPEIKQYLIDHGPVGCRDRDTEEWLKSNNIPAYFSGCLTLTLQRNPLIKRKDYIIAVDIPHEVEQEIKKRTTRPVYNISREISPYFTQEERFQIAKIVLYLYQSAHCVITSRLHAAMPCLALETPVLLLDSNDETIHNDGRYKGLAELCNIVKENDFMADKNSYDIATPPRNPSLYLDLRHKLIEKCSEFTGFNNEQSLLDENIVPELELLKLIKTDYKKILRTLWWIKSKYIIKILLKKKILRKNKYDLNY